MYIMQQSRTYQVLYLNIYQPVHNTYSQPASLSNTGIGGSCSTNLLQHLFWAIVTRMSKHSKLVISTNSWFCFPRHCSLDWPRCCFILDLIRTSPEVCNTAAHRSILIMRNEMKERIYKKRVDIRWKSTNIPRREQHGWWTVSKLMF